MNRVHPRSFGLAFAVFLGTWHALWAFLVWAGAAQWLLDFVFRLHMITPAYHVMVFSLFTATGLVLITATIGYVSGWFIGFLWNEFVVRPATNWQLEQHEPRQLTEARTRDGEPIRSRIGIEHRGSYITR